MELDKIFDLVIGFFAAFALWGVRSLLFERLRKLVSRYFVKTERDRAIMLHFGNQVAGRGHASASPVDCGEGKCVVFGGVQQLA